MYITAQVSESPLSALGTSSAELRVEQRVMVAFSMLDTRAVPSPHFHVLDKEPLIAHPNPSDVTADT